MLTIKPGMINSADIVVEDGQALVQIVADDPSREHPLAKLSNHHSDLGPVTFFVPVAILELAQRKLAAAKAKAVKPSPAMDLGPLVGSRHG